MISRYVPVRVSVCVISAALLCKPTQNPLHSCHPRIQTGILGYTYKFLVISLLIPHTSACLFSLISFSRCSLACRRAFSSSARLLFSCNRWCNHKQVDQSTVQSDFSNLEGKRKLFREIGSSRYTVTGVKFGGIKSKGKDFWDLRNRGFEIGILQWL